MKTRILTALFAVGALLGAVGPARAGEGWIDIVSASYGPEVSSVTCVSAPAVDATASVKKVCQKDPNCDYTLDPAYVTTSAVCWKNFDLRYRCPRTVSIGGLDGEADGQTLQLTCPTGSITVTTATYGGVTVPVHTASCPRVAAGNATGLVKAACDGKTACAYTVNDATFPGGDPAQNCWKSFAAEFTCDADKTVTRTAQQDLDAQGGTVYLTCQRCAQPPEHPDSQYTLNAFGDEVTDTATHLTWKRCSEGQTWTDPVCKGEPTGYTWSAAMHLSSGTWRLPSYEELKTLIDSKCGSPMINDTIFPNTRSSLYWSATDLDHYYFPNNAYFVWFGAGGPTIPPGGTSNGWKDTPWSVRLVTGH